MTTKIVSGHAYILQLKAKNLVPYHHKKAAGGYRDYTTNPIPKNEVKQMQVDRASQTNGRNESRTTSPTTPKDDKTKGDIKDIKENEAGTTSNMRSIMMIGAVLVAAAGVYYYYR